jgi:hypothetical protein
MTTNDWVRGYRAALARTIVRLGDPIEPDWQKRNYGSQFDYKLTAAVHKHQEEDPTWSLTSDPTEEVWTEFAGTFASTAERTRRGFKATVSCSCGSYKDLEMLIETSFPEFLFALLQDEA